MGERASTIELHALPAEGPFPNNPTLPVILYRGALEGAPGEELARRIERAFHAHGWTDGWRDTVYDYAHYHSTAHEVLGCFAGHARVELGGGKLTVELRAGDVVVLPAGVAHKNLGASDDFAVVGAYAGGRKYDMRRGRQGEREDAEQQIARVPLPEQDPVFGSLGPLIEAWQR
jgi:uncharacterized protein YjlB